MHRARLLDLYTRKLSLQEPVAEYTSRGIKLLRTGIGEFLHTRSLGWGIEELWALVVILEFFLP